MKTSVNTQRPSITVSSLDADRIEALLASDSYKNLTGVDALEGELARANIVEPDEIPAGLVTMNSTVQFIDETTNEEHSVTLVYPGPNNPPDAVSILAPVGIALLGLSVGQSISWQVPDGRELRLRVLNVVYQPEAGGEFHR